MSGAFAMKVALLSAVLALVASSVAAQPRPSTQAMTCNQTRGLIASRGAIVLNTSPTTYDRFVASQAFCLVNETIEPVWAPTRDTPQCPIGYRCREAEWDFWD
jgi:hypothetical protein